LTLTSFTFLAMFRSFSGPGFFLGHSPIGVAIIQQSPAARTLRSQKIKGDEKNWRR